MKNKTLLKKSLFALALISAIFGYVVSAPSEYARAAGISCVYTDSSTGVCSATTPLPSNCTILTESLVGDQVQMECDGYPQNYDCSGTRTSFSCSEQNFSCRASSGGDEWDCSNTVLSSLPANCTAVNVLIGSDYTKCKGAPSGYTCAVIDAGGTFKAATLQCGTKVPPPVAKAPATNSSSNSPSSPAAQTSACAGTGGVQLGYCPLEPLPGLANPASITLPDLLNALFKILLSLGALFAVVMLTLGGLEYMVSTVPGVKSQGRERAWAAIWGLLLLAASYLILYTINPNLTKFTLFTDSTSPTVNATGQPTLTGGGSYPTPPTQAQIDACKQPNRIQYISGGSWSCH
jgi:hypothetical protein